MPRMPKPYIRCEKRDGKLLLTVMRAVPGGHVLGARGVADLTDVESIRAEVVRCIDKARLEGRVRGKQANGNS